MKLLFTSVLVEVIDIFRVALQLDKFPSPFTYSSANNCKL